MGRALKKRVIISIVVGLLCFCGVVFGVTYFLRNFLPITVLGKRYNYKDLQSKVTEDLEENNPVFDMPELNQFVTYNVNIENLLKAGLFTRINYAISGKDNSVDYDVTFNKDGIKEYLEQYNTTATDSVSANIVKSDTYSLVPEKLGTKIDIDELLNALDSSTVSIKVNAYLLRPETTKDDLMRLRDLKIGVVYILMVLR